MGEGKQQGEQGAQAPDKRGAQAPDKRGAQAPNRRLNLIIGVALVVAVVGAWLLTSGLFSSGSMAQVVIRDGDGNEQTLPLSEDAEVVVDNDYGYNRIVIEDGSVCVAEADCPHQDCVDKGKVSSVGQQIVCLPHELIVSVVDEGTQANYDVIGS